MSKLTIVRVSFLKMEYWEFRQERSADKDQFMRDNSAGNRYALVCQKFVSRG